MVIFSILASYPVFHFAGIKEFLSPEPRGSSASIHVCYEIWPSWIRLSYQVGFTFGHILLPSIFIVSILVFYLNEELRNPFRKCSAFFKNIHDSPSLRYKQFSFTMTLEDFLNSFCHQTGEKKYLLSVLHVLLDVETIEKTTPLHLCQRE